MIAESSVGRWGLYFLTPVITVHSAGAKDNKYGFEDGRGGMIGRKCHLIATEMFTDPFFGEGPRPSYDAGL